MKNLFTIAISIFLINAFCDEKTQEFKDLAKKYGLKDNYDAIESNKVNALFNDLTNKKVNSVYTKSKKAKIRKKAEKLYKQIREGDKITVQQRYGRGYQTITGVYRGTTGTIINVGSKRISIMDISETMKIRLAPEKARTAIKKYIHQNFDSSKFSYKSKVKKEVRKEIKKKTWKLW